MSAHSKPNYCFCALSEAKGMVIKMYRRVMKKVSEFNIDAYLVINESNRNWLCSKGNYFLPGILLVTQEEIYLVTPSRNINFFKKTYCEYNVLSGDINTIFEICKEKKINKIGFESNHISKDDYDIIKDKLPKAELISLPDFIENLRMIKTASEIELIQEAVKLSDKGFTEFLNHIKIGMTERHARNIFNDILMGLGADGFSFDTLLSSGIRCFLPHCMPSEKFIENGEFVLIDFGITLNGYCSDTTRTIVMGHADEKQKQIYNLVLSAQENALKKIKAGLTMSEADSFARNIIMSEIDNGCFDYGLGHGIGMAVHEKPRMHPKSIDEIIQENTVVSVEPGIYIEGWGGVRIEDLLVVGKECNGRNLTKCTKELLEI